MNCSVLHLVFVALLYLNTSVLSAQRSSCDHRLTGTVIDEHDHTPLSFAEIYIASINKGTVCDPQGRFALGDLCAGDYLLRITHVGCEPVMRQLTIPHQEPLEILLAHRDEQLKQVEVQADLPDEQVGRAVVRLGQNEIERAAGTSLSDLLAQVDGVNVLRTGPALAKPVIHGLYGDRIVIVDRGVRQEDQQWGGDHAPNFDPLMSGSITVVKGAASVEYGSGALGGVILSEPAPIHDLDSTTGKIFLGANTNGRGAFLNASAQGPLGLSKQLSWRAQLGGSFSGDIRAPDYFLNNTGQRYGGGSLEFAWKNKNNELRTTYRFSGRETGILRAAHIGNTTDLQETIESGVPRFVGPFSYEIDAPRQLAQHHLFTVQASKRSNETDRLVLTYGFQLSDRQEFDRRRAGRSAVPSLDMELTTHTVKVEHKHHLSERVHGKIGVEGMSQENYNIPGTGVRPLIPYYELYSGGIFLIEHYRIGETELEGGIRFDQRSLHVLRHDETGTLQSPKHDLSNSAVNVGGAWSLFDDIQVRFHLASAFRAPNVSELYSQGLHHGSAAIEEGDPTLSTERSAKAILSLQRTSKNERFELGFSTYLDHINDYILLEPHGTRLTIQGAFPVFVYTATDARLFGIDLSAHYNFGASLRLRHSSNLVHGRDLGNDQYLYRIPAAQMRNGIDYSCQLFEGTLRLGSTITSVAQQDRFPVGLDLLPPPEAYHLLDMHVEWKKERFAFSMSIQNITDREYRDLLDQFRYYADSPGRNLRITMHLNI